MHVTFAIVARVLGASETLYYYILILIIMFGLRSSLALYAIASLYATVSGMSTSHMASP